MSLGTCTRQAHRCRSLAPLVSCLRDNAFTAWSPLRGFADDADLRKTKLYDLHVEHGGAFEQPPRQYEPNAWLSIH